MAILKKAPSAKQWVEQYEVDSTTGLDESYIVSKKVDGTWACSCKRWIFHPKPKIDCKHISAVRRYIGDTDLRSALFPTPVTLPVRQKRAVELFAEKYWNGGPPTALFTKDYLFQFAEEFAKTRGPEPAPVEPELSGEFKITRKFRLA
jgi:hypothetical protein